MTLIGLTGGVGMGKSAAADCLARRGLPVVDTDQLARAAVAPGEPALAEILAAFGPQYLDPDGQLRRAELARLVFSDATARARLEAILHPEIRRRWQALAAQWRREARPAGVVVIPLLYETGAQAEVDRVICVACAEAAQRARLASRGWTEEELARRQAAQWPVARKMARADFVVWNDGGLDLLEAQLDRVLAALGL